MAYDESRTCLKNLRMGIISGLSKTQLDYFQTTSDTSLKLDLGLF